MNLAGRNSELEALAGVVRAAVRGDGGALVVSGEAGVGKTALVRTASAEAAAVADVLWAQCLPLSSRASPFLPLTSALGRWATDRHEPAPALGGSGRVDPLVAFDTWLGEVCRRKPLVMVMDDLHWADQSSLDVLMYVLAGLVDRRLAVIVTARVGEGGPRLRRWLADVRRFPGVSDLCLRRLDRMATADQLTAVLGGSPHHSLVDEVYDRTQGNAYLTWLLARSVSPQARSLPGGLPIGLREAVTQAWRGLSPPARAVTTLIAVAGRPLRADQLKKVAVANSVGDEILASLRDAVDAAVLAVGEDDTYWFLHPLLAEVLIQGLLPEERATLHATFAKALTPAVNPDEMSVEWVVDLADHHFRAGHVHEAYRWALLGAEAANRAGGATEMVRLLRRALNLWADVPEASPTRIELLHRVGAAAEKAGDQLEELAAVVESLEMIDQAQQPLLAAELLVRRHHLEEQTGRGTTPGYDPQVAVRLSAPYPDSEAYALAVTELAESEVWDGVSSGNLRAAEAVRLARRCGSARALAFALVVQVTARVLAGDRTGLAEAQEAQVVAADTGNFFWYTNATSWACNCLDSNRAVIDHLRQSREKLVALGAPHCYVARLSADEAFGLVLIGDWRTCVERLRVALGSTPGPKGDMTTRLTAAMLAIRQGRLTDAAAHLDRAESLYGDSSAMRFYGLDTVRAELAVGMGDSNRAVAAAMAGLDGTGRANLAERLLPIAARALSDDAQARRDRGADPEPAVARLQDLRARHPRVAAEDMPGPAYPAQVRAAQAWYDAEVCRGLDGPVAATSWQHAAHACELGDLAWDAAYAWWRAGEALTRDRGAREAAAAALRRAYGLSVDLGAVPLISEIETLARSSRISLAEIHHSRETVAAALPGLTPREREVLEYLVAGRTYSEIARALVLSEKTVSVHVSNLLRKTGTANRVELAQLAHRVETTAGPQQI